MSSIGASNLPMVSLAGSLAHSQRADAEAERLRPGSQQRVVQSEAARATSEAQQDVSRTDLSGDRDPEGRLPWEVAPETGTAIIADEPPQRELPRAPDLAGERGTVLDLDA